MLKRFIAVVCLSCVAASARAAAIYTEPFLTDLAGWDAQVPFLTGYWYWDTQQARLDFVDLGDFAFPDFGRLEALPGSSGGRFLGNWNATTTSADAIGFDLISESNSAANVQIKLIGGGTTNPFYTVVTPPPVGVTDSFFVHARNLSDGWFGSPINSEAVFQQVRSNVSSVVIEIYRNGTHDQTFRVDNIFLSRTFEWDGGVGGQGTNWLTSTNWFADGIPGANSRVIFGSTGSATVVSIDASQATGGVLQVGQLFCTVSNRTFENSSTITNSKIRFNGYGGIFVSAGSNTVTFRNGSTMPLELVGARYRGAFNVAAGGSIIISNCVISQTNVACRVDKTGGGLLYLGGTNTYTGGTRVLGGTLKIGNTNALGSGGLMADGGMLDLNGFGLTVPWLAGATGAISDASAGIATNTFTVNQSTTTLFVASFSNGASKVLSLVKNGTGTLFIAGTNFNTGSTVINTGRLMLTRSGIDSSNLFQIGELGPGLVKVATGAVFGGYGRARGLVDNSGLVQPATGVLICAAGYLQRTNAGVLFTISGTNAAMNQTLFTGQVVTNINGGETNIVTNTVAQTALYPRMQVIGPASLSGVIRARLTNGFVPATGQVFDVISAPVMTGTFSTNSFSTNNLPPLGAGQEWNILYTSSGVSLACVATGSPVKAYFPGTGLVEGDTGTSNLVFTIALSRPATAAVSIAWSTSNGTASAGTDYTATNGLLVINVGEISGQVIVPVLGDTTYEQDETLFLKIAAATNALLNATQATGYIYNDDPLPVITVSALATNENASFNIPFSLSAASAVDASLNFFTTPGSALAGTDYVTTNGTLFIPAGTTGGVVHIVVINENLYETNESFTLNFGTASNAILVGSQVTITILNDDPIPSLSIGDVTQGEGDSGTRNFVFPITLSNPTIYPVYFGVTTTTGGTATAGADFYVTNRSYTLPPGTLGTTFTVVVISDTFTEPNETFELSLYGPTNATLASPLATGTILDDDYNPYPGFFGFVQTIPDGLQHGYFDDPDADGQPNIYEYVFLSDPTNPASLGLFHPDTYLSTPGLRFNRNFDASDVIVKIDMTDFLLETVTSVLIDIEPDVYLITSNPVVWTNIATLSNGIWSGAATVIETGTTNPLVAHLLDPDVPHLTNRHYRVRVSPP